MPTNKQRREAARRKLERQLEARQDRARRRKRANTIASIVGALVVVAVVVAFIAFTGRDKKSTASAPASSTSAVPSSASPSTSASARPSQPAYPCTWTKGAPAAKKATVPSTTKPPKTGTVTLAATTTRGAMTFTLNRADGPCSVASVASLAQQKFYDSTACHRLVTQGIYVLQCGDPTATGTGGPGYSINDEATGKEKYPAGTIAMARGSQANSTGSQFFIVYKDSPSLEQQLGAKQYTVIGKVTSGLNVVTKVAAAGASTGTDGKPKMSISFTKLSVK